MMTTKAMFKCAKCGNETEFSICATCKGVIDVPHNQHPTCCQCGGEMSILSATIKKVR
jgi:predicted nucleic-acid-binding Zn-ribbon protein